ncbi:hypothetical protein [Nocardioides sp. KR10-350]|uniref:hypothetical protein n=1 Tax=Nocardioides cheoyonin TaxID=3156615 RepID=UPI0032B5D1CD
MGKAAQAQAGRDRARDARLKAARERRLRLDPDQLARERRIDEAAVDVEVAWEERTLAEQAVRDAEVAAASAIERLIAEKLAIKEIVQLTGLDQATVRRLRQLDMTAATDAADPGSQDDGKGAGGAAEAAGVRVA